VELARVHVLVYDIHIMIIALTVNITFLRSVLITRRLLVGECTFHVWERF
jgi:hypothetical protein